MVSFVHRADRIDALLGSNRRAGRAKSWFSRYGRSRAGRRAAYWWRRTQVSTPARLAAGLVLHDADGRFTEAAEAVLRERRGLRL